MGERTILSWAEIPVSDLDKAVAFYNAVFDYDMKIEMMGPNPTAVLGSVTAAGGAHLYPGKPARDSGHTLHIAIEGALEDGIARVKAAGGEVVSPPVEIPDGRFVYALDLDGNSIGLFAPKAA